jgi:hypothetical protein
MSGKQLNEWRAGREEKEGRNKVWNTNPCFQKQHWYTPWFYQSNLLLFKYHTVSQDMYKYNFIDGQMKNIPFLAQISMQLMNIQQYNIQIYYTEFHQNYSINAACTTRNSLTPLTKDCISLFKFWWQSPSLNKVLWTSHSTEFYKNNKREKHSKHNKNFTHTIK